MVACCIADGCSRSKYKERRRNGSPISRSAFEVRIVNGMVFAVMVPRPGTDNCHTLNNSNSIASNAWGILSISSISRMTRSGASIA